MTKILILTSEEGHVSIAQAAHDYLKNNKFNCITNQKTDAMLILYKIIYRFSPKTCKHIYKLRNTDAVKKILTSLSTINRSKNIKQKIEEINPDVIVVSHWIDNFVLKNPQFNTKPFITIVSDPRIDDNVVSYSDKAYTNLVFDQRQKEIFEENNDQIDFRVSGWFVRSKFEEEFDKKTVRDELGINHDLPVFLFVAGSEGTNAILSDLILLLANNSHPSHIIVACGNNKTMCSSLSAFKKINEVFKSKIKLTALPFTKKIHKYMQAADLVVGKAGPNTIFESAATLTPFLATTHLAGHEDGNLEIIKERKVGFVQENPIKASQLINKISQNINLLDKFQPHLKKLKKYNQNSKKVLLQTINEILAQ